MITYEDLRELITASFDAAAADAWSRFTVGEADKLVLHEAVLKVRLHAASHRARANPRIQSGGPFPLGRSRFHALSPSSALPYLS